MTIIKPLRKRNACLPRGIGSPGWARNRDAHATYGFTLIELLVVIAIISLLVSILLPSLQKAKALAMQVNCLARLKAIGTALAMYQGDFDGRGPVGFTYGNNAAWNGVRTGIFADQPNPYPKRTDYRYFGWFAKKDEYNVETNGTLCWALGEYVDRKGNYLAEDGGTSVSPVACPCGNDSSLSGTRAGYAVNWYLGYDTFLGDYVNTPANNPMLMDGSTGGVPNNWAVFLLPRNYGTGTWLDFTFNFRLCSELTHDGSANYLFFDGHAENHVAPDIPTTENQKYLEYYRNLWNWYGD